MTGRLMTGRLAVSRLAVAVAVTVGCTTLAGGTAGAVPPPTIVLPAGSAGTVRHDGLAPIAEVALADLHAFVDSGDATGWSNYVQLRAALAAAVADRLGVDEERMSSAWAATDVAHQMALMAALTQLGVPYRHWTSTAGVGFDCSGLTTYAWSVAGVTLTRQSGAQIRAAAPRTEATAMAGDLMYYPGHVMLYLGIDRTMVHAPYPGRGVEVDHLSGRKSPRFGNPVG